MFDDLRYELYGLPAGNPYAARPLDPLALPADRELVLELAGFIRLAVIEAAVKEAISEGKPAFFLITGVGNSGGRRWPIMRCTCTSRPPRRSCRLASPS